jgi:hypothetical protein
MRYCLVLAILFCGIAHAQAPRCNPGDYAPTVNWQVGVASDQSIVSVLWCHDSEGLDWWAAGWNPAEAPVNDCAGNLQSESVITMMAAFWESCLTGGKSLTSPQQTTLNHLLALWLPREETLSIKSVYEYSDGALVGSAQGTVAANTHCGSKVVASAGGEEYYDVSGQKYQNGSVIPEHSAAVCKLVKPPKGGFPQ